jgi:DNA-binding NtrC family response regulator
MVLPVFFRLGGGEAARHVAADVTRRQGMRQHGPVEERERTLPADGEPEVIPQRCLLRVVAGPDRGAELPVARAPVTIGADASCHLVLHDAKVSRRHAQVWITTDGIRVRDLGSRNGTSVCGIRVTEGSTSVGATIELGDSVLSVARADGPQLAASTNTSFGGLFGTSHAMRLCFAVLERAAKSDASVLLHGESGTGKELAARGLHDHSRRAARPFVIVDCGAISEGLVESQLFGHERGAFTGASSSRQGAFMKADGGTLFLDEVGEIPLHLQPKLLRALEAGTVQPVGSDQPLSVDVRVVAATHRDLAAMVASGDFRFDLYHRLAVIQVDLPPLRQHRDDLEVLVQRFYAERGCDPGPIGGDNLQRMRAHGWPGNVRELRNVIERAWALSGEPSPAFSTLELWLSSAASDEGAPSVDASRPFKEAKEGWNNRFEVEYLRKVLERAGGNITRAAEDAGINRKHLRELLVKHGLHR